MSWKVHNYNNNIYITIITIIFFSKRHMWIIIVLWLGDYLYDFPGTIFLKSENRKKSLGLDLKNMLDAKAMRSNFSIISMNSRHGPFLKSDSMLHPLFTNLLFILLIFEQSLSTYFQSQAKSISDVVVHNSHFWTTTEFIGFGGHMVCTCGRARTTLIKSLFGISNVF